ncbi:MAG: LysM peptidoglycan-binding domain-containing protein [Anaerolineales bacterium]|nr:LysM peptidoglycan-binding domain-containing protein [Anaerolineales bacterium]
MQGLQRLFIIAIVILLVGLPQFAMAQDGGGQPPSATPAEIIHTVAQGENLYRIALNYNTTVAAIVALNNLQDPNQIVIGQQLRIRPGVTTIEQPAVTPEPVATTPVPPEVQPTDPPTPADTTGGTAPNVPFAYGVDVEVVGENLDMARVAERVVELGASWVKQEIRWEAYESSKGVIDYASLDTLIDTLDATGANILLTVTTAPSWSHNYIGDGEAPPTNYQDYADFVAALATRYGDRIDAYEIWRQPNLRQNWNNKPLGGAEYVSMLRLAYAAIKAADTNAIVVTAGLAPTGLNDGTNAVDDRVFLSQMYQAGVADYSDAIGAHPYGWANPPDSTCCGNNPVISQWDNHPSFFFLETLQDYYAIMLENEDTATFIWVTEFGWGSSDNFPVEVSPDFSFVEAVSLDEQSQYTMRAFTLGRTLDYVGPMFIWNLNDCQVYGLVAYQCYWSMLDPEGNPRPVFLVIRDMINTPQE